MPAWTRSIAGFAARILRRRQPGAQGHYRSFRELGDELGGAAQLTFEHRWQDPSIVPQLPPQFRPADWDMPGRSGVDRVPKYLYRGESAVYPASTPSRARITDTFPQDELALLDELTRMASWCWRLRHADPFRSIGWPQHHGFPTHDLDLTSDPLVALHTPTASARRGRAPSSWPATTRGARSTSRPASTSRRTSSGSRSMPRTHRVRRPGSARRRQRSFRPVGIPVPGTTALQRPRVRARDHPLTRSAGNAKRVAPPDDRRGATRCRSGPGWTRTTDLTLIRRAL